MDEINTGDTAWLLTSTALVVLMTPALGFFYGGLVRQKNVLATIMHSFFILCLVSVQWVLWGYTLAFGPDMGGIIGGLDWIGLNGVGQEPNADYAATVPHLAFMVFQLAFAVDHACADHGCICRAQTIQSVRASSRFCGRRWCTTRLHTGCGALAAGFACWARSTSLAAPSCTSAQASRRWLQR